MIALEKDEIMSREGKHRVIALKCHSMQPG